MQKERYFVLRTVLAIHRINLARNRYSEATQQCSSIYGLEVQWFCSMYKVLLLLKSRVKMWSDELGKKCELRVSSYKEGPEELLT